MRLAALAAQPRDEQVDVAARSSNDFAFCRLAIATRAEVRLNLGRIGAPAACFTSPRTRSVSASQQSSPFARANPHPSAAAASAAPVLPLASSARADEGERGEETRAGPLQRG